MNFIKYLLCSILILINIVSCDIIGNTESESDSIGFYLIDENDLHDSIWDSGIVSEQGDYMLLKQDDDNKVCIFKGSFGEHPILMIFNNNNELQEMSFDDIYATIQYADSKVYAIIYHDGETSQITSESKAYTKAFSALDTKSSDGNALQDIAKTGFGLTTTGGIINLIVDFAKGKDISNDLAAFGIGELIGAASKLGGLYVGIAYEMYKAHKEYIKEVDLLYFGNSTISINNIIKEEDNSWSLTIQIKDLPNMMSTFGGIKAGVLVSLDKEKLMHPKRHGTEVFTQNDKGCWIADERNIDDNFPNTDFNISVDIDNNDEKQYYARPYMLTYTTNGWVDIESDFIRYGEIVPLSDRWVDLGLPSGILWAAYNVGATSPEEHGGYYAWGETNSKNTYTRDNYLYATVVGHDENNWPIYSFHSIGNNISKSKYDVASAKWENGARMPSKSELEELINHCTFLPKSYNGVNGKMVIGPNGNQIFLPYSGYYDDTVYYIGERGFIWSSNVDTIDNSMAFGLGYRNDRQEECDFEFREAGHTIRPVKDPKSENTK